MQSNEVLEQSLAAKTAEAEETTATEESEKAPKVRAIKRWLSSLFFALRVYFREAAKMFARTKILAFASAICALRIAVKSISLPLGAGLHLSFDCYINAVGSLVYGPLVALAVGAVSDTVGAVLFPQGVYFFPYIFVEMSSGFIFALFLWRKKLSSPRLLIAKFTVNFFCNILLTSLFQKWYYAMFEAEKVYYIVNAARIVKNLVLFPLEATLICMLLNALLPALRSSGYLPKGQQGITFTKKEIVLTVCLFVFSVALVLFYIFFLKDFISAHNIKWF